jgi:hypothetical protein
MQQRFGILALAAAIVSGGTLAAQMPEAQDAALIGGSAPAREGLTGRVADRTGSPLGNAHVDIFDCMTGESMTTLTRGDGAYDVGGLAAGHVYTITVRRIGFAPETHKVAPTVPSAADFTLRPIRETRMVHGAEHGTDVRTAHVGG